MGGLSVFTNTTGIPARDAIPAGGALKIGAENCQLDERAATLTLHAKPVAALEETPRPMPPGDFIGS